MPWKVVPNHPKCPSYKPYAVVNQTSGAVEGCHPTQEKARKQQQALYAQEPQMSSKSTCGCSPRERAERARTVARRTRLNAINAGQRTVAMRLERYADRLERQGDQDWDDDAGHLVQAVDAVLDEALEAFQAGLDAQGRDLVVGAAATIDQALQAMGLPDSDEGAGDNEGGMGMSSKPDGEIGPRHVIGLRANVDESAWDGPAAMSNCAKSDSPASCYGSICAGKKAGDTSTQEAWALPHHKAPGDPPNRAGVRNALSRLPQTQGLTNRAAAEAHLKAHQNAISGSGSSSAEPHGHEHSPTPCGVIRGVLPLELRDRDGAPANGMPTLVGNFAVFDQWTRIDSLWEGEFMERIDPHAFDRAFREERDQMRVLFQHGRDPQIGSKPLGPIRTLEVRQDGAYYEVPLLDTSYVRDLLPPLREGLFGASFRFEVICDEWNQKPGRSDYNPDGLPERTLRDVSVMEFGPVTFPAYAGATAGLRSLTDEFWPTHTHDFEHAGRSDAGSADGGDSGQRPGHGAAARTVPPALSARERALRLRGI